MVKFRVAAAAALLSLSSSGASAQQSSAVSAEARDMFAKLVSYRSIAGSPAVAEMAAFLSAQFESAGFDRSDVERVAAGERTGLIVRYRGAPGSTKRPVLFLAHMDVVDANPKEWATDPWTLTEKNGALYGRGTVDNKFGVLTLAQAFMRLKREGFVPDRDLVIAFSGDEEAGMQSTRALAERLKGAAFAINSDAGGGYRGKDGSATFAIQAAEKTYATFELTVRNKGGHSSRPRADNAIYSLARALQKVEAHSFPARWNAITIESFKAVLPMLEGEPKARLAAFIARPSSASAEAMVKADPSFASEVKTTCVATMLRAGSVENALPTEATATVNCRIFPGETVAGVQQTLAQVIEDKDLEIKVLNDPAESPVSPVPEAARTALDAVLAKRAPNASVSPYMEAGGTDGLQFRRAGIPTVGVGPLFSTDESNYAFHGVDERLPLAEFEEGLDHYYLFIKALASGGRSN